MNQQFGRKASGYLKHLIDDELVAFMKDAAAPIPELKDARKRLAGLKGLRGDTVRICKE